MVIRHTNFADGATPYQDNKGSVGRDCQIKSFILPKVLFKSDGNKATTTKDILYLRDKSTFLSFVSAYAGWKGNPLGTARTLRMNLLDNKSTTYNKNFIIRGARNRIYLVNSNRTAEEFTANVYITLIMT